MYEIDLIEIKMNSFLEFNFNFSKINTELLIKRHNELYIEFWKLKYIRESIIQQKNILKQLISEDYKE